MANLVRAVAAVLFGSLVIPLLLAMIQAGPFVANANSWLGWLFSTGWYFYALVGVGGFAVGVWLDWFARRFDGTQSKRLRAVADEAADLRVRIQNVWDPYQATGNLNARELTLITTEFLAMKVTFGKLGLKVPRTEWMWGTPPDAYVIETIGYLGAVEPLLARGHLKQARQLTKAVTPDGPADPSLVHKIRGSLDPNW